MIGIRYIACVFLIACASTRPETHDSAVTPRDPQPVSEAAPSVHVANAHRKTVAILGLEVIGPADPDALAMAKDLTLALRERPATHIGPYKLQPNTNQALADEVLIFNCASKLPSCMSAIGKSRGAEMLVWGELVKRPSGYRVTMSLLDSVNQTIVNTTTEEIERTANAHDTGGFFYKHLVGDTQIVLFIRVNVDRGTVYVDGEARTPIYAGMARVLDISPGRHRIMLELERHQRIEEVVVIDQDDVVMTVDAQRENIDH